MPNLHVSPHAIEVTKILAEGSFLAAVVVISLISAATLVYAWFIA